jgi:hypothetical protein
MEPVRSAGPQAIEPAPPAGNPARSEQVAPSPPLPERPRARPERSLQEQAAFIAGNWRLSDETCVRRQNFSIEGEVISVAAGRDIIGSYRIERVEAGGVVVLGNGARYVYDGRRLSYVEGDRTVRTYEACG